MTALSGEAGELEERLREWRLTRVLVGRAPGGTGSHGEQRTFVDPLPQEAANLIRRQAEAYDAAFELVRLRTADLVAVSAERDRQAEEIARLTAETVTLRNTAKVNLAGFKNERARAEAAESEVLRLTEERDEHFAAYNNTIEALQAVCDKHGCLGGEHRINWIDARLSELTRLQSAHAQLAEQFAADAKRFDALAQAIPGHDWERSDEHAVCLEKADVYRSCAAALKEAGTQP